MPTRRNSQMFALPAPPPQRIELDGAGYRLVRVFKHDFYAATCLYQIEAARAGVLPKVVVKFPRTRWFLTLPMAWHGRWLRNQEERIYRRLAGVAGVPRWAGRWGDCAYAIEYIEGEPLDHFDAPPRGFFDALRKVFDDIHARGVAYGDSNKRSNLIVGDDGGAHVIDFQISLATREDGFRPFSTIRRAIVRYLMGRDLYHLYKHKRRMCPGEMTDAETAISLRRGLLHAIHRKLTDPYRWVRRRLLYKAHRKGKLVSPTAHLEDHHQPEKKNWRKP